MKRLGLLLLSLSLLLSFSQAVGFAVESATPEIHPSLAQSDQVGGQPTPQIAEAVLPTEAPIAQQMPERQPWLYPISQDMLSDPLDVLRLVNKANLLDAEYPPKGAEMYALSEVSVRKVTSSEQTLRPVANDALARMFAEADAEDVKLYVKSAYRSYRTQEILHYNRLKEKGRDDGVVQAAGASDHQTGLGVDVVSWAWREKKLTTAFADTKEGQWLAENCARFGFVVRYLEGKEDITGIMFEPWHLRYVGVEVATYMTMMGLTLEEFTAEWKAALEAYEEAGHAQGDIGAEVVSEVFVF